MVSTVYYFDFLPSMKHLVFHSQHMHRGQRISHRYSKHSGFSSWKLKKGSFIFSSEKKGQSWLEICRRIYSLAYFSLIIRFGTWIWNFHDTNFHYSKHSGFSFWKLKKGSFIFSSEEKGQSRLEICRRIYSLACFSSIIKFGTWIWNFHYTDTVSIQGFRPKSLKGLFYLFFRRKRTESVGNLSENLLSCLFFFHYQIRH